MNVAFETPLPLDTPFVMEGADQLYSVWSGIFPLMLLTGAMENAAPLQITALIGEIEATGLTVTVSVNEDPLQEPEMGVILNVAV